MGNFSNNSITNKGRLLLADVQAGAVFIPTRIVIGEGSLPSTVTTQTITDVIAPIKSLSINKKKRSNDGKCTFGGAYTNVDITEPFYFRELALYAKAVYLNDDGSVKSEVAEVLYSYGNAGDTADFMPAYSASTVVEKQIDLVVWIGNNAKVDLTIESGIYATKGELAAVAGELADVANGAVKKTGDTMTGEFRVAVAGGNTVVIPDANCTYIQSHKDGDEAHKRTLVIRNKDYSPDLVSAVTLGVQDDGTWKEYALIHTENLHLITPPDIGAVNKAGDTMTGILKMAVDGGKAIFVTNSDGSYIHTCVEENTGNDVLLIMRNIDKHPDLNRVLTLAVQKDGVFTDYHVLHTGNMEALLGVAPAALE